MTLKNRLSRLALLAILPLFLVGCQPSPGATVNGFFKDLEKGEIDKVNESLSAETTQLYGSKLNLALQEVPKDIASQGGIKKVEILEENVNGDRATVSYRLEFGDGTTENGSMDLIKEGKEWKVSPMGK